MAESTKQTIPEDFYWVAYLREDIQDLRQDQRHELTQLRGEMQEMRQELRGEMQDLRQDLRGEMQDLRQEFRGEIQEIRGGLQEMRKETGQQINMLVARNDETNKRLDSRFAMMMTTMIGLAGVIIAVIKL